MARSIADIITSNNNAGRITKIILPVGPTPQYRILANICNEERIKLKNLWIFFMEGLVIMGILHLTNPMIHITGE